jgi:hypothetical protein
MKNLILSASLLMVISLGAIGGCHDDGGGGDGEDGLGEVPGPGGGGPPISISPNVPSDISGGASNANLQQAAVFAWQEFIALNWAAESGTRDTPDTGELFGDTSFTGPLVWQTYRHKVEIYPGMGNPPGFDPNSPDFGYSTVPPQYVYHEGEVKECTGQTPISPPAWVNLDEISQIGLASMFAGVAPTDSTTNDDPQLIRFLAKANEVHYVYVVEGTDGTPETSFWNHSQAYNDATSNFEKVATGDGNTLKPPGPVIDFPDGMIEVKTAFRELTEDEQNSGRFYQTTVRYYEQDDSDPNSACYREAVWGMLALHIIHKTPTAPYFIFATFEQADNLLTQGGQPVEDAEGRIINPPMTSSSTTPGLTYMDGNPPTLNIVGNQYCTDIEDRLYYLEEPLGGLPDGGDICQNERDRPIPPIVTSVNQNAHNAINQYNNQNGLDSSPWLFYKLVNVQWRPFDVTEIDENNPNSDNNDATFYLNNIVVETDFTLQNFSGRIYGGMMGDDPSKVGPPSDLPANFNNFDTSRQTFQNVLLFDDEGNLDETFNMGGCMGCHGNAQLTGDDFSFILSGGPDTGGPEAPGVTSPGATNPFPMLRTLREIMEVTK